MLTSGICDYSRVVFSIRKLEKWHIVKTGAFFRDPIFASNHSSSALMLQWSWGNMTDDAWDQVVGSFVPFPDQQRAVSHHFYRLQP